MTYRIVVQPVAADDLRKLFLWIAQRSPEGAVRWYRQWLKALESLQRNPLIYGLAPESDYVDTDIRQALFRTRQGRTYRALFSIDGDSVRILHIRGPGQAPVSGNELE